MSHYFGEVPAIDIEKFTNGLDADTAPGPVIQVGHPVAWTYEITNTGNVPLSWSVTDDQLPTLECPALVIIVPGQTIVCSGPLGATAQPGQYANIGTVEGISPSGAVVTDTDPSHYLGAVGGIDIEKFTNGVDVTQPPGPFVVPGSTVTWTYEVTNTGNVALVNVAGGRPRDHPPRHLRQLPADDARRRRVDDLLGHRGRGARTSTRTSPRRPPSRPPASPSRMWIRPPTSGRCPGSTCRS